jgi:hypothetical protein
MRWRTNLVLLLVAGLLSAYIAVFESGGPSWESAGKVFPRIEPADIVEIEVRSVPSQAEIDTGSARPLIRLRRRGPYEWWIEEPIQFRAFLPRVQGLAWELADMVLAAEVPRGSPAEAEAEPAEGALLTVSFQTRSGFEGRVECLRDHPVLKDEMFARVNGRLIITRRSLRQTFTVTLTELRSRAILPVAPPDAVYFAVRGAERRAHKVLAREGESSPWRFGARDNAAGDPADGLQGALADRELVKTVLEGLNGWQVQAFTNDKATDFAAYGLNSPELEIEVRHRDGTRIVAETGKREAGAEGEEVYVRHAGQPFVFRASAAPLASVAKEAEFLRTRWVFDLEGERIVRAAAKSAKGSFVIRSSKQEAKEQEAKVERPGGGGEARRTWVIEGAGAGGPLPGDKQIVDSALGELRQLLIEKFLAVDGEAAASYPYEIEIETESGRKFRLGLGARAPGEPDYPLYPAVRSGDSSRFLVHSLWPERLDLGPYFFKDRAISELESSAVLEVEVAKGKAQWLIMRLPGEIWTVSADTPLRPEKVLDQGFFNRMVLSLHRERFRVRSFLPNLPKERFEECGIGTTDFRLRFSLRTLAGEHRGFRHLRVGYRVAGEDKVPVYYARVDASEPAFTLTAEIPELLDALAAHLEEVTERK